MSRFGTYYAHFRGMRNDLTGLPPWARAVFIAIVLPGIALVALSILVFVVSVAALLILAIPVYSLLRKITRPAGGGEMGLVHNADPWRNEAKHVDATVRDPDLNVPDELNGE